jgi:hypothetical protein
MVVSTETKKTYNSIIIDADNPEYRIKVTPQGRAMVDSIITGGIIQQANLFGWNTQTDQWNKILVKEWPANSGEGWLGIFGEVGSTTRAKKPIDFCIRKVVATQSPIPIIDKIVPTGKIWYITSSLFANELASELQVFKGLSRNYVNNFTGDGSTIYFTLDYQAIPHSDYISVTVGGVQKVLDTDYYVEDHPTNDKKSRIKFKFAPANGAAIVVTYDAVERRRGYFVQSSSSFIDTMPTPLRLIENQFIVALLLNKSSNAGVCVVTIGGFELTPEEDIWGT